jgi:hypothetical protein
MFYYGYLAAKLNRDTIDASRIENDLRHVFETCHSHPGMTVALAGTGRTEQEQVGCLVEPGVAGGQCHDMGLAQHRHNREIEIVEGFAGKQTCLGKIAFGPPAATSASSSSASVERKRAAGQPSLSAR